MNLQDVKTAIDKYGRNNFSDATVIEIKEGKIEVKQSENLLHNQLSLIGCVFDFSRDFNDSQIESLLPELNILINISVKHNINDLYK